LWKAYFSNALFGALCKVGYNALVVAALMPAVAFANPQGGTVSAGSASISQSGNTLSIRQNTERAVIDWRGFNIAPGETTQFNQPNSGAIALNRVNSAEASQIDGTLTANGNVIIINPNGVMFGRGANIDVNGLIATTANISNQNFMAGKMSFDQPGNPDAVVSNAGTITAKQAGLVGLVAPTVENSGTINAKLGRVQLSSGDKFTADLYGDGLLEVTVSDATAQQLASEGKQQTVTNTGTINAEGDAIALTAAAAGSIVNSLITVSGELNAPSIGQQDGKIIIYAEGSNAVPNNVAANKGQKPGVSAVVVSGTLNASGMNPGEKGGTITVTADKVTPTAHLDASGDTGGGIIQIGGDFHGAGVTPTALVTDVQQGAVIEANAANSGDGGDVTVWADQNTAFNGTIQASAEGDNGDGGFVETSGRMNLVISYGRVTAASRRGRSGAWLLDPNNILIDQASCAGTSCSSANTIGTSLSGGTNVTITTTDGSITLDNSATITDSGSTNVTLTFNAGTDIVLGTSAAITNSGTGKLNVTFDADTATGGGAISVGSASSITTNGGNIVMGGGGGSITAVILNGNGTVNTAASGFAVGDATYGPGITLTSATLNAGSGSIILNGNGYGGTAGSYYGVDINAATVEVSGTGGIAISGAGGGTSSDSTGYDAGVYIAASGIVESTASGAGAGTITIQGTGGDANSDAGSYNLGVWAYGGSVTSVDGNIGINGTGGNIGAGESGGFNWGIGITHSGAVSASGNASITLNGTAISGNAGYNFGVGIGNGSFGDSSSGTVSTTSGNLTITGTGGDAESSQSAGVYIYSASTVVSVVNGNLTITGTGKATDQSGGDIGVWLDTGSVVNSTGTGSVNVKGVGGGTGTGYNNRGMYFTGGLITATSGSITVTGVKGGGSGGENYVLNDNVVIGTGSGTTTGNITLIANDINSGVNSLAVTTTGNITIKPYTSGTTVGVGSGAGSLNVTTSDITLTWGGTLTIGDATNTAAMTINDATSFPAAVAFTTNGANITLSSNMTTGGYALTFNDPVVLGANRILTTAGGAVNFNSTVNGAHTLTVANSAGAVTFGGAVGGGTALTSLSVSGSGGITVDNNVTTGAGVIAFTGPVTLGGNSTMTTTNHNVTFSSTLDGASSGNQSLAVSDGTAATTFTGVVGGSHPLGNLTLTDDAVSFGGNVFGTGTLTIQPSTITTILHINDGTSSGLYLTSAEVGYIQSDWAGIVIGSTSDTGAMGVGGVTWNNPLTLNSGSGNITVANGSGSLSFSSALNINTTTGNVLMQATGDIVESGGGNITTQGGNIVFDANSGNSGAGAISLGSNIFTSNGGAIDLGGGSLSSGLTTGSAYGDGGGYRSGVALVSTTLNSGGGNITISGTGGGSGVPGFLFNGGAISSGVGNITITVNIGTANNGLTLENSVAISSSNGNISITGTGDGGSSDSFDIASATITASGSGNISLTGTVPGSPVGANFYITNATIAATSGATTIASNAASPLYLDNGGGGNVTIGNGSTTGNIIFADDNIQNWANTTVQTTGTVTFKPYTSGGTVGVGSGTGNLAITSAILTDLNLSSAASLTIGDATNTGAMDINYSTSLPTPVTFTTNGANITLDSDMTTSGKALTYNDPVVLGANRILTTAGGAVNFNSTVNGAHTLTVANSAGAVTFGGAVGGGTALTSLTVSGSGTSTVDSNITTGAGVIAFTGPVILGGNSTMTTTNHGVTFSSTLDGASNGNQSLAVSDGTATTTFTGVVGGSHPLGNLTLTDDAVSFGGNVLGTGTLTIQPSTLATILHINDGTSSGLYLTAAEQGYLQSDWTSIIIGRATETGAMTVGATTWSSPLTLITNTGNISITGNQAMGSNNLTISTNDTNFSLTGNLTGSGNLTIMPTTGTTTMDIGGTSNTLNLSSTEMGKIVSGWNSETFGANGNTGAVKIDANTFSDSTYIYGGAITTGGSIAAVKNLTIGATGDITDSNTISKTSGSAATLTLTATGNITQSAAISGASGHALNVVMDSSDAGTSGYIYSGANITTYGGNISMGGGSLSGGLPSGAAYGNAGQASGIDLNSNTLNAAGGGITLTGHGYSSGTAGDNYGVIIYTGTVEVSGTGNISITGTGGGGASDTNGSDYGVYISNGGIVHSTASQTSTSNGTITITGTAGDAGGSGQSNHGVIIGNYGTGNVISVDGNISITGNGGNSSNWPNFGITITNGAVVSGTGNASVTLNGTGNGTGGIGYGVDIENNGTVVSVKNGNLSITGNGSIADTNGSNFGVYISGGDVTTTGVGNISITGTGGGSASDSMGGDYGVYILGGTVESTANGAGAGAITIHGTGGDAGGSGGSNSGVAIGNYGVAGGNVSTVDGNISIIGQGGNTTSGVGGMGIALQDAASISASGNASISLQVTGGNGSGGSNVGFYSDGSTISTIGGAISITGIDGTGGTNFGYWIDDDANTVIGGNSTTGNISIILNDWTGHANYLSVKTSGNITIEPYSTDGSGTVGVGSGSGNLQVTDAILGDLTWGNTLYIGGNTAGSATAGAMDINSNYNYAKSVAFFTGTSNADITIDSNLSKTSGGDVTDTLSAYRNILFNAGASSTSGKLNFVVDADNGGNHSGYIATAYGVNITTYGGDIYMGGGSLDGSGHPTGAAWGNGGITSIAGGAYANDGIVLYQAGTVDAGGGNITITGTTTLSGGNGINFGETIQTSGTGNITLTGTGTFRGISDGGTVSVVNGTLNATGSSGNQGIVVINGSFFTATGTGNVIVQGTGASGSSSVLVSNGGVVSTNSGNLSITGNSTGGGIGILDMDNGTITTASGNITLTSNTGNYGLYTRGSTIGGSSTSGNITLAINSLYMDSGSPSSIQTSGNITVKEYTAGQTIGVGTGTGNLSLTDTYLGYFTFGSGKTFTIGDSSAGAMDINSANTLLNTGNVNYISGGAITVDGAISKTAGGTDTLTLEAGTNITQSAAISGASGYALNVVMDSSNSGTSGYIDSAANITTWGGNITMGGGALSGGLPTTPAYGNAGNSGDGIYLNGTTLTAAGGNITMTGTGYTGGTNTGGTNGIYITTGTVQTSGAGTISITGTGGGSGSGGNNFGVQTTGNITTVDGNISITGNCGGAGSNGNTPVKISNANISTSGNGSITINATNTSTNNLDSFDLGGNASITAAGSGNISLTGTALGGEDNFYITGATIAATSGTTTIASNASSSLYTDNGGGNVTIGNGNTTGNIIFADDAIQNWANTTVQTTGTVTFKPYTTTTTVGVNNNGSNLDITSVDVGNGSILGSITGASLVVIGNGNDTGVFTATATNWGFNAEYITGSGNMSITGNQAMGSNNLTISTNDTAFSLTGNLTGSGNLTIMPTTGTTTMDIGGASNTLNLSSAEMGKIVSGWSSETFGASGDTGAVKIDANTFNDNTYI